VRQGRDPDARDGIGVRGAVDPRRATCV